MRFELTTTCLASKDSTTELHPHYMEFPSRIELDSQGFADLRITILPREQLAILKGLKPSFSRRQREAFSDGNRIKTRGRA